ncbi:MAG: DNA-directed RNA polymerase subunit beta' [Candidatus Palauibacterales bacterium]|nr:DNA-directed RNA polymerase subunit beta' [Candidatus Palauibacterales bacterium]
MIDFPRHRGAGTSDFDWMQIKIASPDEIRSWSYGEVTKPETINYRSFKPERDGLFCERIFGPVKDWECHCGKFKRIRYRGHVCDKCGVEVTLSKVRRERMGHIELAVPVAHIWFFKTLPSQMGYLLGMKLRDLESVIYYAAYVVTNPGGREAEVRQVLTEDEYWELIEQAREEGDTEFRAEIGAEAVRTLMSQLDVDKEAERLRVEVATETSKQRKKKKLKRLKVIDAIRNSDGDPAGRNNPEHMVMDVIPVIPPDLRPLVPLDGGRFATSDLNDLYRRVINRNNRLKKLLEMRAPEVILRNEKRMLQEAVDALFDNGRRGKAIRGRGKRPLKSLSDMLKGKQGRFRQNLLGKRVDYSGRSVIVVGPELQLHQCGLPKVMAVELFKPFIIHELERRGDAETVKRAKKLVERYDPKVYEVLEDIIKDHPVLLNRAPTLHRLGIQAFEPVLVEGKAIRIHPLVCAAFNADFDGDQMAVHVPLSFEAQLEARILMLSSNNVLKPSNGRPIAAPSQDMVLGCYYVTKAPPGFDRITDVEGLPRFTDAAEIDLAMANGHLRTERGTPDYHHAALLLDGDQWILTTVGRILFNDILPDEMPFENSVMSKGMLGDLVFEVFRAAGMAATTEFLDRLKNFGFGHATHGGVSVGMEDMVIPVEKATILAEAQEDVDRFTRAYHKGVISFGERYNKVIDAWTHANNDVADAMVKGMADSRDGYNPIYMMFESGSRGSRDQIRQLAGMRGLMAKPQKKLTGGIGEIIESPIRANFREGLSVLEYFISTHGARKGLADTALKTADAGYLTRRLVDVAQDVTVVEEDCGTVLGLEISALKEGEDIIEPLGDRVVGNVAREDVVDPISDEVIVEAGEIIGDEAALAIEEAGLQSVKIRSVLTCEARRGLCQKCYGRNLATMKMVDVGEAVGILAAQSIGEPGTQLTLRTFHIGGTAARIAAQTQRKSKLQGTVGFERVTTVESPDGHIVVTSREGQLLMRTEEDRVRSRLAVPYGAQLHVTDGQEVNPGDLLFGWDPYSEPIVADHVGKIQYNDIVPEETFREELDEATGRRQLVIIDDRDKKLHPRIEIVDSKGKKLREFIVPVGAQLLVHDKETVQPGDTIAKISREAYKTRDITGGLPRVAELFEARRPKDPATITEVDGRVSFGGIKRGKREILVTMENDEEQVYQVAVGKHLRVHEGDQVRAGDRLSEGPVNPHDILRVKGPRAVQEYLLNEIQEVYRLQGVRINDKHIGVIVRQMLQKVKITDPGDTEYLEGEHVDRMEFRERTREVIGEGGKPPRSEPVLLGITKSSLTTESFISAASFQETTRVLTDAAVRGAKDDLRGLKENIIIGHLVPAGTGIHRYQNVEFLVGEPLQEELDALRRRQPEPEEPIATAGGLFAELRGEMDSSEAEVQSEA